MVSRKRWGRAEHTSNLLLLSTPICIFPAAETFSVREKGLIDSTKGQDLAVPANRYVPLAKGPPAKSSASLLWL